MVDALIALKPVLTPEDVVDGCLELMGHARLHGTNRQHLLNQILASGEVCTVTPEDRRNAEGVILWTMKMIGSTREYQFA